MSKAANRKNTADILKEQKKDRKKFFAARRQLKSGISNVQFGNTTINNPAAISVLGGNFNIEVGWGDPLQGGNFTGPIAFNAVEKEIDSNKLTMASFFETPTSYCIANGEGGAADDLANIITKNIDILGNPTGDRGALFNGQLLYLQAGDANITLKHNTGNIFMPSGSDLTLNKYDSSANTGGSFAILMWDDQNVGASSARWVLVSSGTGGGGGTGMQNPAVAQFDMATFSIEGNWDIGGGQTNFINVDPTVGIEADLDMNTFDIKDVCRLGFELGGSALAATISGISASTDRLHFNVPTGDYHYFTVNDDGRMKITADDVQIQNWVDIRNPTTTVPGTAGSGSTEVEYGDIAGWVKIQVDGGNYSFPVWALP